MNRKHELFLIKLGLETLLDRMVKPSKPEPKVKSRKWTVAQRRKFKATMLKKFEQK